MIIRPFAPTDAEKINEIYAQHHAGSFSVPSLERGVISGVTVNDNSEITGFGIVTLLAEAVLVMDLDISNREKKETIEKLLWLAIQGVSKTKMDGIHAFVQDPRFAAVLKQAFGFRTWKGEALYLEL